MCDYRVTGSVQTTGEPSGSEPNGQNVQVKSIRLSELVRKLEDSWDYLYGYNAKVVPQLAEQKQYIVKSLELAIKLARERNRWIFICFITWAIMIGHLTGLFAAFLQ